jgi:hypothetical protein
LFLQRLVWVATVAAKCDCLQICKKALLRWFFDGKKGCWGGVALLQHLYTEYIWSIHGVKETEKPYFKMLLPTFRAVFWNYSLLVLLVCFGLRRYFIC